MALPEDFNKIYGSTATGGLTPISDVNYAKGWEFVGSNPPTKNDFSYLQNLSDLKSQWLYSNKLQRTNPFGDIKSDGSEAISTALTNLGLKSAATRDVGTGADQIPDMSAFSSNLSPTFGSKKLAGLTIMWGPFSLAAPASSTQTVTFPDGFENECVFVAPIPGNSSASQMIGAYDFTRTTAKLVKGNQDQSARSGTYIAIGY